MSDWSGYVCPFCGARPNPLREGEPPSSQTITHAYDPETRAGCPNMYGYGGPDAEEQRLNYERWWLAKHYPGLQNTIDEIRELGT